ncbi:hypothetical protein ACQP00_01470 [Dactylosporangium sp. CS-047395]|uniref:hypothetical protein n=1 Tax=Dactylosporangium sp. CS-047395 TaxID=3239936 RepID=UPI003D8BCFA5
MTAKPQGAPPVVVALNVFAVLWIVGGLISLSALWPENESYGHPTTTELAPALIVACIAGLAATIALAASAIVTQLARRNREVEP